MTLDPTKDAVSLDATNVELSDRDKQNRYGEKRNTIPNIGHGGFISVIVAKSKEKPTAQQWFDMRNDLISKLGVEEIQALFEMPVPLPEEGFQNNLHTSAHLRQDPF